MLKTKALISTAQLICVFVFVYAYRWFSRAQALLSFSAGRSGHDFYSLSDFVFQFKRKFSTSSQRFSTKFYDSALEAVKDIPSDCKLLVGGKVIFGIEHLLRYNSS